MIPYKAYSAATLTALGADSIIMHSMGVLGPTDPTVTNPFNPEDSDNRKIGISVEDVTAYIALVKEDAGITHEEELVQAFNLLANQVHPLALGNVKRSLSQSRMMANKLLSLHMDSAKEQHKIDEIVDNLTSKLYYHGHPINRIEAEKHVGLQNIHSAPPKVEEAMWNLYLEYEKEMLLKEEFNPLFEFISEFPNITGEKYKVVPDKNTKLTFIESKYHSDIYNITYKVSGKKLPNGVVEVKMLTQKQGWQKE